MATKDANISTTSAIYSLGWTCFSAVQSGDSFCAQSGRFFLFICVYGGGELITPAERVSLGERACCFISSAGAAWRESVPNSRCCLVRLELMSFSHTFAQLIGEISPLAQFLQALCKRKSPPILTFPACVGRSALLMLEGLEREVLTADKGSDSAQYGLLLLFLVDMLRSLTRKKTRDKALHADDVLAYLREYCQGATLARTAAHFFYHPNTIANLLQRELGKSFTTLLKEIKLEQAEKLMRETGLPIQAVADLCGYKNMTHFYNMFRERYGMLPGAYRRRLAQ